MRAILARPPTKPSPLRRAAFAHMVGAAERHLAIEVAGRMFPTDKALSDFLTRSPTAPADSTAFDGSAPAENIGLQFLRSLPDSAAAQLMSRAAAKFTVDGAAGVTLPTRASGPMQAPWVAEAAAIPVAGDGLNGIQFPAPKKLGVIFVVNRALLKRPMAEAAVNLLLSEAGARSLDSAIFSDQNASEAGLAGLLYQATDASDGIASDDPGRVLAQLASTVSSGGSGEVIYVSDPATAAALRVLVPHQRDNVFPSGAIEEGTIVAVDPMSFVFGVDGLDIEARSEGVIHMEDESPAADLGEGGVASPLRGAFQTNAVAFRMTIDLTYVARRTGAVAFVSGMGAW